MSIFKTMQRRKDIHALKQSLLVYKQSMQFGENCNVIIPEDAPMVHTVSCDKKTGIQATLSLLAGINLLTEVNKEPVVYHWAYKLDEISQEEAQAAGVKSNQDIAS